MKTKPWNPVDHLDSPEAIQAYLRAAIEEGDPRVIATVLADVSEAKRRYRKSASVGAGAIGSLAVGTLAIGAIAIGAIAIGAMAIGKLSIRETRIHRLRVDELTVGRLVFDGHPAEPAPVRGRSPNSRPG